MSTDPQDGAPHGSSSGAGRDWLTSGCDLPLPAEIGALLLRLHFGFAIFWGAGVSKFPLDNWFADQVADLGFPAPTLFAWAAALSEVAGGVLLMLGLLTRPAAFFLAFTLAVAAFRFHGLTPMISQHITQLYLWGFVFFLFAGSGRLSLDGLLRKRTPIAAGLGVAITVSLALYCASRTLPDPAEQTRGDLSLAQNVSLAGSLNDWSLEATPMTSAEPGIWSATVGVDAPTPIEFKFVGDKNWDLSAGESDQPGERFPVSGVADPGPDAENIEAYLPRAGRYEFRVELPSLEYTVTEITAPGEPGDESVDTGSDAAP